MSTRPLVALLFLLALPLAAQPPDDAPVGKLAAPQQDTVDLSTPQLAVRSFVAAANRFDFASAARCVEGGKPEAVEVLKPIVADWKKSGGQIFISDPKVRLIGDAAVVNLAAQMKMIAQPNQPQEPPQQTERVLLRRKEGEWKIVGNPKMMPVRGKAQPAPDTPPGLEPGSGFITMMATFLANPQIMEGARSDAHRAACQGNLKQLALAAFQLANDKNATLNLAQAPDAAPVPAMLKAAWQKAFFAYARSEQIFICPLVHSKAVEATNNDPKLKNRAQNLGARAILPPEAYESYSFNAVLDGIKLDKITDPAATVLLYEGKDGKLEFRHDGKANVAFADGHVEAIEAGDVARLLWQPKAAHADDPALAAQCQNHLKQLALGLFQLRVDGEGKFDFEQVLQVNAGAMAEISAVDKVRLAELWQLASWPYVKSSKVHLCPAAAARTQQMDGRPDDALPAATSRLWQSYSFNVMLQDMPQKAVPDPQNTVLLYEGKDGKLDFRHDGKANVAFADGHVEILSPDDVKKLIWNPKGIK